MLDILNPWRALREARKTVAAQGTYIEGLMRRMTAAQNEADILFAKTQARIGEINALKAMVAKGHFRNPATGRLGKRGETFE